MVYILFKCTFIPSLWKKKRTDAKGQHLLRSVNRFCTNSDLYLWIHTPAHVFKFDLNTDKTGWYKHNDKSTKTTVQAPALGLNTMSSCGLSYMESRHFCFWCLPPTRHTRRSSHIGTCIASMSDTHSLAVFPSRSKQAAVFSLPPSLFAHCLFFLCCTASGFV